MFWLYHIPHSIRHTSALHKNLLGELHMYVCVCWMDSAALMFQYATVLLVSIMLTQLKCRDSVLRPASSCSIKCSGCYSAASCPGDYHTLRAMLSHASAPREHNSYESSEIPLFPQGLALEQTSELLSHASVTVNVSVIYSTIICHVSQMAFTEVMQWRMKTYILVQLIFWYCEFNPKG